MAQNRGGPKIDAVIRTGGKQYRVHEGSVLNVATMDAEPGSRVELRDVLLVTHEGAATVGTPTIDGAVVVAEVVEHGRGPKVINCKYKAKVRYRRKRGHRQGYTTLSVREITANGGSVLFVSQAARISRVSSSNSLPKLSNWLSRCVRCSVR